MSQRTLQLYDFTSWDMIVSATSDDRFDSSGNQIWTGSISSTDTGHSGVGRSIYSPGAFRRTISPGNFDTFYVRLWWKAAAAASSTYNIFRLSNASGDNVIVSCVSGKLRFNGGAGNVDETGTSLANDTWYDIELAVHLSQTSGSYDVRLNGVAVAGLSDTGVQTSGHATLPTRLELSGTNSYYDDLTIKVGNGGYSDDVFMADTAGYPKIATLYPNADGAYEDWTLSSGTSTYALLDEKPNPGVSDYVSSSTAGQKVSVAMEDTDATASTIYGVKAVAYMLETSAVVKQFIVGPERDATNGYYLDIYHRATRAATSGADFYDYLWEKDVRTGKAWTKTNVDALELGWEFVSGTSCQLHQVTAEVLWAPASSTSGEYLTSNIAKRRTHRHATCWHIIRKDGVHLRFTNADRQLEVDGETYTPVGGINATAERREGELRERNKAFLGVLSTSYVTHADLRAGRYRGAIVEEFVVDWRFPFAGTFDFTRYWISNTRWNGHLWEAQVNGLTRWLKPKVGDVYARTCRWDFGEPKCFYHLESVKLMGVRVDSVSGSEPRRIFSANTSDVSAGFADDYFAQGRLVFSDGDNWGLEAMVRKYTSSTRTFELAVPLPYSINAGEVLTAWPGCARTWTACQDKDNWINFGGFPFMPGTDKMLQTPYT